jgi:hypothetical protein
MQSNGPLTAEAAARKICGNVILEALKQAGLRIVWEHEYNLLCFAALNHDDQVLDKLDAVRYALESKLIKRMEEDE